MPRTLSLSNLYNKRHRVFEFSGLGVWGDVLQNPEKDGIWLIYGSDKNGKTRLSLKLAEYLSHHARVLFVSGEEGTGPNFVKSCAWAGLTPAHRTLSLVEYLPIIELQEHLTKRRAPEIVFLDNITIYHDELSHGGLRKLLKAFPHTLFIMLAHEERKEPYTATAKLARKLAKVIIHVQGLTAFITGRCPGGVLTIDPEKSTIYHGEINQEAV